MLVSEQFAKFATRLTYDSLPAEVAEYAWICFVDFVGVTAMSSQIESPQTRVRDFVLSLGGSKEGTVVGAGERIPTVNAAWANGAQAVGYGIDGFHQASATHMPAVIVSACMAAAERAHASGKELITALVAGAEVMLHVSMGLGSDYLYSRGFHPTSISGPFGAAVAAGKLLGLNEAQLVAALGMAGVQAAGLTVWGAEKEITTYPLQVGKASQSGVIGALLASTGYTACEPIFEHRRGFIASHAPQADPARFAVGLGEDYEIMNTTLGIYAVGQVIYTVVDAMLMLMAEHPEVRADNIDRVSVGLPTNAMPLVGNPQYPESATKAHLSTRYLMVLVPMLGEQMRDGIDPGIDKWRLAPAIQAQFEKTEVHAATELDPIFPRLMPAIVEVTTKDGHVFKKRFDGPTKGHPPNRLTVTDAEDKFVRIAGRYYGQARAAALIQSLRDLTDMKDVAPLIADVCRVNS